jgi:hypothetical protein
MLNKKLFQLFLITLATISFIAPSALCQTRVLKTPSNQELRELLDFIFPKAVEKFDGNTNEFSIDIRINPSFQSPMQISITKNIKGDIYAHKYSFVDKSKPIFEQLIVLDNYGKTSEIKELGKNLKLKKEEIVKKKLLQSLVAKFFSPHKFQKQDGLNLDGTFYEIWYVDNLSKFYFSQSGSDKFEKDESTLITFAREISQKAN